MPEHRPLVALLSDFGVGSAYVGAMKGALLAAAPDLLPVDLTHAIAPQDLLAGALALAAWHGAFPAGTVFLAVVDPGVGGPRRGLALEIGEQRFVGPDNGLFGELLRRAEPGGWRAVALDEPSLWRHPVSDTFHGRDVFAPVAAALAGGLPLARCGSPCGDPLPLERPFPRSTARGLVGEILLADAFGNLTSNVTQADVLALLAAAAAEPPALRARIGDHTLAGLARRYEEVAPGRPLLLIGSAGFLEVAVAQGSAHRRLGSGRGSVIELWVEEGA